VSEVKAEVRWYGDWGFVVPRRCDITLVDAQGKVVWEGHASIPDFPFKREPENYPYRSVARKRIDVGGPPIHASEIREFACRTG
jgi:hypothetical protein